MSFPAFETDTFRKTKGTDMPNGMRREGLSMGGFGLDVTTWVHIHIYFLMMLTFGASHGIGASGAWHLTGALLALGWGDSISLSGSWTA